MKKTILMVALLSIVSCGKETKTKIVEVSPSLPEVQTLTYVGEDARLQGLSLNIDLLNLNKTVSVLEVLPSGVCEMGTSAPNTITISSSNGGRSGTIKFSALNYGGNSNPNRDEVCRVFNNESFDFVYDEDMMVLFSKAEGKAWDKSSSVFMR